METGSSRFQSKRARQIVVETEFDEVDAQPSRAAVKMQAIKDMRDQFDDDGRRVGMRDSTWALCSVLALAAIASTWHHPSGIDLFARLMVIAGGVTIAAAVGFRGLLSSS